MLFTTPEKNARSKTNTRMHEEGSRPKMELGQLDQQEECRKKGRRHFLGGENCDCNLNRCNLSSVPTARLRRLGFRVCWFSHSSGLAC